MASTPADSALLDWAPLAQFIARDLETGRQLLELLEQERRCLENRDYTAYEALVATKQTLLAKLEASADERRTWQRQRGIGDDTATLAAVTTGNPALGEQWQALAVLWRECQQTNQINEQICQRSRAVVSRLLDLMSGNSGQGSTYDAAGTTHRTQTGRSITSA